jgi:hypothetical protein
LCQKYGGCDITTAGIGWNIKKGKNEIYCPDKGQCECLNCGYPTRTQALGIVRATIIGVPSSTVVAPSRPPIAPGGILDSGSVFSSQGPAGAGSPASAPAAPPPAPPPVIIR